MKSFSSLLGTILLRARTLQQINSTEVSIRKEDSSKLSTLDQLKLSKASREGGVDKFSFFEANGKVGSDFKVVYDLHMRIESLSKDLTFFDMKDVF